MKTKTFSFQNPFCKLQDVQTAVYISRFSFSKKNHENTLYLWKSYDLRKQLLFSSRFRLYVLHYPPLGVFACSTLTPAQPPRLHYSPLGVGAEVLLYSYDY